MISNGMGAIVIFVLFFGMLAIGIPIALALAGSGAITLFLMQGSTGFISVAISAWQSVDHSVLMTLPLFVLMGEILIYSGVAKELMELFSRWFSGIPGGLGIAAVYSCAVFGAMSGSSAAACATIGGIAIPEMRERGYSARLSCGTLAAAGGLAILIPPSNEMILYAVVSELSIGRLFMAGILPGIALATLMALYIFIFAKMRPSAAPATHRVPWRLRFASVSKLWPASLLIAGVLGGMYSGVMTPSEAAAGGALLAWILVAFYYKGLSRARLWQALAQTTKVTGMILIIIAGAGIFGFTLIMTKFPQAFAMWMLGITGSKWVILAMIIGLLLVCGTFLTVSAMTFVIVPLLLPIIAAVKLDPLVFAITYTILAEAALITPPIAVNLFVIRGVAPDVRMVQDIALGALPFVGVFLVMIALLWVFPQIVHFIPSHMR